MTRALAVAVLALASCRSESKVEEQPQPLEPSGNPVAQGPAAPSETHDDGTATAPSPGLPPSDAKASPRADKPARASDPRPSRADKAPRSPSESPAHADTPPREPSIEEQLPPSLFEANGGG